MDDFKQEYMYKASLKIAGSWFRGEGETLLDAVMAVKAPIAKGMGILVLEKGDIKKEKILSRFVTANLFGPSSPTNRQIALKIFLQSVAL